MYYFFLSGPGSPLIKKFEGLKFWIWTVGSHPTVQNNLPKKIIINFYFYLKIIIKKKKTFKNFVNFFVWPATEAGHHCLNVGVTLASPDRRSQIACKPDHIYIYMC
jgi:hypothetical protein